MKVILLALALAACSSPAAPQIPAPPSVVTGTVKTADGIELAYDVRGRGETALVFVHCWSCDRTYWKNQLDEFARDYRVVSLDLGGHGASGDNRATWTIAALGGDVQAVIEKLELKRVIVIGHSMGGPVSLDVARRLPGRVIGVVCADTLHDAERKMPPEMAQQIVASFETDFAGTMREGMKFMLREKTDPALRDWLTTKAAAAKPVIGFELGPLLAAAKVPIRCINAAPAGEMAPATNIEVNRKHADFDAVIMDDVGHFLQLEKPEEFNAKLRAVLATWK
jgi:pimeloyl-ACP methyl ester carboxylesterase